MNVILEICVKFSHPTKTLELLLHYTEEKGWWEHLKPTSKLTFIVFAFWQPTHYFQAHDEKSKTFARGSKEQEKNCLETQQTRKRVENYHEKKSFSC